MIIKSMLTTFMLLLLTTISNSSMIVSAPFKIADIEAQDQNTTLVTSAPSTINVTIGDLIVEGPAVSTGIRVLDVGTGDKGPKIEVPL